MSDIAIRVENLGKLYRLGQLEPYRTLRESLMSTGDLERIGQSLNRLVDEEHRQNILLDFTKVRYLSSQAIGMLISLHKKLLQAKGSVELLGVSPQLLQLLKITKLDRILKIRA